MKKQQKQGYLGTAFHEYLEWLEYVECVTQTNKKPGKIKYMSMSDKLFKCEGDDHFSKMMMNAMPVDAWLARVVRSSVKYKASAETLALMLHKYEDEMEYIKNTRPLHLPHEWCTLVVEEFGKDSIILTCQETTTSTGEDYPELGVKADETWIDVNICFYRKTGVELMDGEVHPEQRLSYCPVELHLTKGQVYDETKFINAVADGVIVTEHGEKSVLIARAMLLAWLHSFHLSSVLRSKSIGGKPMPISFIPRKRRKRHDHPAFEHFIVEMEVDEPDAQQVGRSVFQPKKRLHQVRGFFRHLRTGKSVWVKPHWRGDEHLGVVRKDFEMTMHENNGENNVNEPKGIRGEPTGQTGKSGSTGNRSVLRDGSDSVWNRTRKALGAAWVRVVRTSG